jgi:flagellar basal body-associated protein FliL
MTTTSVIMLIVALVVVWGGLAASIVWLSKHPERTSYPDGGIDDHPQDAGIAERDT